MRRFITILLIATVARIAATAGSPFPFAGSDKAQVGVYIEDLATGQVLADYGCDDLLVPASVTKSVTAATLLAACEPTGCFTTVAEMRGPLDPSGTLRGNLAVRVVGDPTIESSHFAATQGFADSVAVALKRLGVTCITGSVVIDQSFFTDATVPHGWEKGDLAYSYGTLARGANYHGNARGKQSVSDPAAWMRSDLEHALARQGIQMQGGSPAGDSDAAATTVYVHRSPAMYDILHSLMVRSDNLFAEAMLRALEPGQPRSRALSTEAEWLASQGLDLTGIKIYDGSGLSRANRLSPRFLGSLYRMAATNPCLATDYTALFPRAGKEGTMRGMLKDTRLEGLVAMKTGSMSGVQCFGGYLLDASGVPTHVIVVMVNGFTCDRSRLKGAIASWLLNVLPD